MFNRERVIRFLLRGPGTAAPPAARWTILLLAATGAGFLVWSAVIHLELWSDGYRDISVIGPLFLLQGIGSILVAVAIVALRWLVLLAAGAVTAAATAVGLLLTVHVGLFGYKESLAVPYAELSLAVEFTAAFLLLAAAVLLAASKPARIAAGGRRGPLSPAGFRAAAGSVRLRAHSRAGGR
jgi:hypothetical protein